MTPTTTLLVDDSPSFLESAMRFLAADARIDIVGLAQNGREALRQWESLRPELVLMDWAMPDMNGLEATRQLKSQPEAPRVIILTLHDSDEYRAAAVNANADGFVAKQDFGVKLLPLIDKLRTSETAGEGVPDGNDDKSRVEEADDELAERWRQALLRLSESCLRASQTRHQLAPIMQAAMHTALEQLLLHGNHEDLLTLEEWLRDNQHHELVGADGGWLPSAAKVTSPSK